MTFYILLAIFVAAAAWYLMLFVRPRVFARLFRTERGARAVFGGIFFLGLLALNALNSGTHITLHQLLDICLLREAHSRPALVVGYLILLGSLVPTRWLAPLERLGSLTRKKRP